MIFMTPEDAERHVAERDSARHEVKQMLLEMNDDHLRILEMMVDTIANGSQAQLIAWYFSGQIAMVRQMRFDICAACGKNHEADLAEIASGAPAPETPAHVGVRRKVEETLRTQIGSTDGLYEHEIKLMEQYNLDDLRDEETQKLLGFVCLNCGMRYPSVDARTTKPPGKENCLGCIEKEKWG